MPSCSISCLIDVSHKHRCDIVHTFLHLAVLHCHLAPINIPCFMSINHIIQASSLSMSKSFLCTVKAVDEFGFFVSLFCVLYSTVTPLSVCLVGC